ncbi:MAG TPA: M23 family metallopeptidase, partial [Caldilineaceae bacterium]|nr:M23 family metallopeptidase [Caldilineaceae bacterium]
MTSGAPVYAVADGVVAKHNPGISYPGNVVIIRHRLADGRDLYSMYGHVTSVKVVEGQAVTRGQQIASVIYQGYSGRTPSQHPSYDAHLHFEMRWFLDGTNIYV